MAKRNRYAGVLQPRLVGRGKPETSVLVLYDIEEDRIRNRVADVCFDYGLERIQFSAFLGKLTRNHREELQIRLTNEIGSSLARVRVIPVCGEDIRAMYVLDQYRLPEEAARGGPSVSLRIVRPEQE